MLAILILKIVVYGGGGLIALAFLVAAFLPTKELSDNDLYGMSADDYETYQTDGLDCFWCGRKITREQKVEKISEPDMYAHEDCAEQFKYVHSQDMKKPSLWKIYFRENFPLKPVFIHRKPDLHNTRSFTFKWLFFKVWTLDSVGLELAFVCDSHWGIGFTFHGIFIRFICTIPLPEQFGIWFSKKFHRKPKIYEETINSGNVANSDAHNCSARN